MSFSAVTNFFYDNVISWFYTSKASEKKDLRSLYRNGYPIFNIYPHVLQNGDLVLKGSKGPQYDALVAREAGILASLEHKNIIRFIDFDPKSHIIAFQYLEGNDIFAWIEKRNALPAKLIFRQLLEAVSYIASKELVHGDVSVFNVQYDFEKKHVTLIDFASAGTEGESQVAPPGMPHAAPEQMFGANMQKASDVWCVALIAHMIITQYGHPYQAEKEHNFDEGSHIWAMTRITGETIADARKIYKLNPVADFARKIKTVTIFEQLIQNGTEHIKVRALDKSTHEGDLLTKMLTIFPSDRITAAAALEHPYFTEA